MSSHSSPSAHFPELESIRGIAALLVALYHIPFRTVGVHIPLVDNGYLMVPLFFVLSGFVISNAYGSRIKSWSDLFRFQFLRFGRLYPVHLFILGFFVVIEVLKRTYPATFGASPENSPDFNLPVAVAHHLFLIQGIGPTGFAEVLNGPAWSISVEFYTYLLFGLMVLVIKRNAIYAFCLLFGIAIFLEATGKQSGFAMLINCFAGFFLGCIVFNVKTKLVDSVSDYYSIFAVLLLFAYLLLKPHQLYDVAIFPLSAFLILSITSSRRGVLHRVLNYKLFLWLGAISYSLYMCHQLVEWIAWPMSGVVIKRSSEFIGFGSIIRDHPGYLHFLSVCVTISAVLLFSHIAYKYIEAPLRLKSRRIVSEPAIQH